MQKKSFFKDPDKHNNSFQDGFSYEEDLEKPNMWYHALSDDLEHVESTITDEQFINLQDEAKKCYNNDVFYYNSKNIKSNSDYQWIKTVLTKGTISDKIAAYTISIQDDPLHNLENIRKLVDMMKVSKKESIQLIEVLSDLFLKYLLHPNRKLKYFKERPLSLLNEISSGNAITRKKYLSYWYFEDQLKEIYVNFVMFLNKISHDSIEVNKEKGIKAMSELLSGNAEQEKNLLSFIVNKLGDPSQKISSKTMYFLLQVLRKHSNMQGVVLLEVEKLLFRSNISKKTQYYALCFLSQYYLSHDENEIAEKLIEVYFSFFKACVKLGEVNSRMMSVLLIGVNRSYPFAKLKLEKISEHIEAMYKIVHIAEFNVGLNALTLLYQISDFSNVINDRYYSTLYRKLFDPAICLTKNKAILINLIYKSLKKDKEINRIKIFIKRLLQIVLYVIPSFGCSILYLISQLISETCELKAFHLKASFVDDNDDEERYTDVKDDEEKIMNNSDDLIKENVEKVVTGWTYRSSKKTLMEYSGNSRNPLYAGGEFCSYNELILLTKHFHPSVSLFATNILNGEKIVYGGDPLKDFQLIRFLDRFVFKNPKKTSDIEVERKGSLQAFPKRKLYVPKGPKSLPLTSDSYINQKEKNVPADERFLYLYLRQRKQEKAAKNEEGEESDNESVKSEEFEEMLDKMSSMKDVDDDLDFMNDIGDKLKNKISKQNEEGDDNDDVSDEENNLDEDFLGDEMCKDDEELIGDISDDEASDIEFDFDDDDDEEEERKSNKKFNMKKTKKGIQSMFASAEEFATLLEDEGNSKIKPGSAQALANKDNADMKQIVWEQNRNRWVKGFDKIVGNKRKKQTTENYNRFKGKNKKLKNR